MKPSLFGALAAGVAIPAFVLSRRYRRALNAARARLSAVERHTIATRWGAVEYAERGCGDAVLVVHGILHNCVGGLLSVRGLLPDRHVIGPSRFGYLGSSMPPNATPADQADAFVALLDALGIDRTDVIGESAGATSALQLALRHPERVKHLAVLVGNLPGSPTAVVQPSWAKLFNRQLPLWLLRTFAPSIATRVVAAVPKGFAMTGEHALFVSEFIDSLFPVSPEGVDFDAFVSNAAVNNYDLEAVRVPTLIIHTKDDQLASHEASRRAAARITGARFVSLESGGHLMLGQTEIIGKELTDFFAVANDRRAERAHPEHRPFASLGASRRRHGAVSGEEDSIMVTTERAFFEEYLAAWNAHDPAAVARYMADDAIYEDVALGRVLHGPSEIAAFVEEATKLSSDFRFEEVSLFTVGSDYANEWIMTGTNDREVQGAPATGRSFRVRGASVGKLDTSGRIVQNRDYYNLAELFAQLGMRPTAPPSAA